MSKHPPTLPVAPSFEPTLQNEHVSAARPPLGGRTLYICVLAIAIGIVAAFVARLLTALIGLVTNLAFYQRVDFTLVEPVNHQIGAWVLVVPVVGGLIVGVLARYGSSAIRGHGIPEAMEGVLTKESRIPARVTLLKPLSAAVTIGTGGPFGAEGPIIATGGSLGSLLGQLLRTTADERKVLLAAGAAAGMTATFGTPIAAVLLVLELLLFEFRPRSIIPVSLAVAAATSTREWMLGAEPVFAMPEVGSAGPSAVAGFLLMGLVIGAAAILITRLVYAIEDAFDMLPIHWMWWPAIGAIAVGVVGYFAPATLGVGYVNIERIIEGHMAVGAIAVLCIMKLISWSISLGSGTSGGTLAPLFIIGGGLGVLIAAGLNTIVPALDMNLGLAGLVGMASMFAGASRAFLASVVFAFESTQQAATLLPLLAGCSASYLVSLIFMEHSIMTEKIARRGIRVPSEYTSDFLDQCFVGDHATREVVTVHADRSLADVRAWLDSDAMPTHHQGFPVVDGDGLLLGVVTRRDLHEATAGDDDRVAEILRRDVVAVRPDDTLRAAADLMTAAGVGRLPVVDAAAPREILGILTRTDLLEAHARRLEETQLAERHIDPRRWIRTGRKRAG